MQYSKKTLNEKLALVASVLSSPQRLEILEYIAQVERGVDELSQMCKLSIANTSRHLQILKQIDFVIVTKKGTKRLYRISSDDIVILLEQLRKTTENHIIKPQNVNQLTIISQKKLLNNLNNKEFTILDVRPSEEFDASHIFNAINIPIEDIVQKLNTLEKKNTIITYCRGVYCLFAENAVKILSNNGFQAKRLQIGLPEWRASKYPTQYK